MSTAKTKFKVGDIVSFKVNHTSYSGKSTELKLTGKIKRTGRLILVICQTGGWTVEPKDLTLTKEV